LKRRRATSNGSFSFTRIIVISESFHWCRKKIGLAAGVPNLNHERPLGLASKA
jgi:hypothetical protein